MKRRRFLTTVALTAPILTVPLACIREQSSTNELHGDGITLFSGTHPKVEDREGPKDCPHVHSPVIAEELRVSAGVPVKALFNNGFGYDCDLQVWIKQLSLNDASLEALFK